MVHPGVLLARVQAEGNGAAEGEGRVLAEEVVRRGVAALDGAVLHGVDDLKAGTISPAAKAWIWNLPSVISATRFAKTSAPPKSVSRLFGKLDARRHFISGSLARWPARQARPRPAAGEPGVLQELATFHDVFLPVARWRWPAGQMRDRRNPPASPGAIRHRRGQQKAAAEAACGWTARRFASLAGQLLLRGHEVVEVYLGDLEPQVLVVAERLQVDRRSS